MIEIGTYQNRKVIFVAYNELLEGDMPTSDWICLAISNNDKPNKQEFFHFARKAIVNGISEFKGQGIYGETLHHYFDDTMVTMETLENHEEIMVMTTCHNDESLADTFWQCFFCTCLPETTDFDNIKILQFFRNIFP